MGLCVQEGVFLLLRMLGRPEAGWTYSAHPDRQQCCFAPRNTAQCAAGNSQLTDALHCLAAVTCSSVMMPGEYFDPNERMLGRLFETTARIGVLPGAGLK